MEKILLFTDIHICPPGEDIIGLDPIARFNDVLSHALANHPDANRAVFMGDLTHHGAPEEYEILKTIISDIPIAVTLVPGNHDRRAGYEAVFGKSFHQSAFNGLGHRILCLDTLNEQSANKHSGLIGPRRLDWLQKELTNAQDPIIVLMHHHIAKTGFDGMDDIMLENADQVAKILAQSGKVRHVINGHIHRTIFTSKAGLPVSMIKSPCHQMPLYLGKGSSALSVVEPGAYGILCLYPDQAILHVEDVGLPEFAVQEDGHSQIS